MSLWTYSGLNSAGLPVKGKVVAEDVNGAKSRLEKMGIRWDKVGDEVVEEPVDESKTAEQAVELIKSFQQTAEIPMEPRTPSRSTPPKRQVVLFGTGPAVQLQSKPFLERGGRVIHASMSPDSSGRPHVLLVIEAEEEK